MLAGLGGLVKLLGVQIAEREMGARLVGILASTVASSFAGIKKKFTCCEQLREIQPGLSRVRANGQRIFTRAQCLGEHHPQRTRPVRDCNRPSK